MITVLAKAINAPIVRTESLNDCVFSTGRAGKIDYFYKSIDIPLTIAGRRGYGRLLGERLGPGGVDRVRGGD